MWYKLICVKFRATDLTGIGVVHWLEANSENRGVVVLRKDAGLSFQHAAVPSSSRSLGQWLESRCVSCRRQTYRL